MGSGGDKWMICLWAVFLICGFGADGHSHEHDHHSCGGHHHHHDHHHHEVEHHHVHRDEVVQKRQLLPEEIAEEEDLRNHGFGGGDHHDHQDSLELSGLGLWMNAMGCSLLVSLASLICLIILPLIFIQGKPSKAVVDSLALFGAGAMLGDAFLHQLPHAFGGAHSHSLDHHSEHHDTHSGHEHLPLHSHSLEDLSVGLSILGGVILFLLVEKLVRYVEGSSRSVGARSHGHHHHLMQNEKLKTDKYDDDDENLQTLPQDEKIQTPAANPGAKEVPEAVSSYACNGEKNDEHSVLRKRNVAAGSGDDDSKTTENSAAEDKTTNYATENKDKVLAADSRADKIEDTAKEPAKSASSLVFGYLNLFSDGVHNFTDGMALGSAFLLYGSIGGWSRTLFLLAHELPQEIGDFGILVRSGFSVSKALFFNFLSALVALAGTALALMMGQDPGQSSLIEGFTAGGFIYIAVAGVLAEMNSGTPTLKSSVVQLLSLMMGMGVALWISLVE